MFLCNSSKLNFFKRVLSSLGHNLQEFVELEKQSMGKSNLDKEK